MHTTPAGALHSVRDRALPMAFPAMRRATYSDAEVEPIKVGLLHADPIISAGLRSAFGAAEDLEVQPGVEGTPVVIADFASAMALMDKPPGPQRAPCVIVAGTDRESEIRRALARGAKGYLVAFSPEELVACVRAVHRGEKYLSPVAARRLAESVSCEALTGREQDVLRLVVKGLANKQIATRLGIAVDTVKSHLKSIFEKLRVRSRTQAMAAAETRGILDAA